MLFHRTFSDGVSKSIASVTEKIKKVMTAFLRVSSDTQLPMTSIINFDGKTCDLSISIKQTLLWPNVRKTTLSLYRLSVRYRDIVNCCTIIQSTYF